MKCLTIFFPTSAQCHSYTLVQWKNVSTVLFSFMSSQNLPKTSVKGYIPCTSLVDTAQSVTISSLVSTANSKTLFSRGKGPTSSICTSGHRPPFRHRLPSYCMSAVQLQIPIPYSILALENDQHQFQVTGPSTAS